MKNQKTRRIVSVVLAFWIFFMGFELGKYNEKTNSTDQPSTSTVSPVVTPSTDPTQATEPTQATQPTEVPSTPDTSTPVVTDPATPGTPDVSTPNASADPSALTQDEVAQKMCEAVDKLTKETDFTAVQDEDIQIQVLDCSVAAATNTVNSIVQSFVGKTVTTFNFVGGKATGVDQDGKSSEDGEQTVLAAIPPSGNAFTLTGADCASATAAKDGDSIVYTAKILGEKTTLEDPIAVHHAKAVGFLDLTTLGLPSIITLKKVDMTYEGATVTIKVGADGRITNFDIVYPIVGEGEADIKILVTLTGAASFGGSMNENWTFTY